MAEKAKKKKKPFYMADLELVRISKYTARFKVVNPEGAPVDIHHIEIGREVFPKDVDFNFDFIKSELPDDEDHDKARKKQANFREFMRFKMAIIK